MFFPRVRLRQHKLSKSPADSVEAGRWHCQQQVKAHKFVTFFSLKPYIFAGQSRVNGRTDLLGRGARLSLLPALPCHFIDGITP
jgi:hypothetical protein